MAAKGSEMAVVLVVALVMWHGAWAQPGCSNAMMTMAPCLNFVTGNSTKPSSACCSSLAGVLKTQPQCLCTMMNGGGAMTGFSVNQTLAMELPTACNVQTPPASRCNGATSNPAASPPSAPAGLPSSKPTPSDSSSNDSPATNSPSSTGTASKSTPSTTGATSGASSANSPLPVAIFLSLGLSVVLRATKF